MRYSDEEIITALKKGEDDKVLPFLYKNVLPKVIHYIKQNKGNEEEAKDIFQDAVIVFYKKVKREDFKQEMDITSYICYISRNFWINRVKKMNRIVELNDSDSFQTGENFLEEIITEEKKSVIHTLLSEIGEECKKLLRLSVYENLSMKEICKTMGYSSENVAKTYNYRCKQKLVQLVMKNKSLFNLLKNES